MVSDGSSQQRLACPGRTVHENTFGLSDTQGLKNLRMFDGQFDNLLDLFDLLIESSDHVVGRIWDFFNLNDWKDTFMREIRGSTLVGSTLWRI